MYTKIEYKNNITPNYGEIDFNMETQAHIMSIYCFYDIFLDFKQLILGILSYLLKMFNVQHFAFYKWIGTFSRIL